jgi:subtilase family serine protease
MVPDYFVFEYSISNAGSATADSFSVLTFDYASDGTMDTIDHFVVTAPLEPGDSLLENYDVSATQSGTYKVYASIDSDNTVDESNETDNEAELDVTML